MADPEDPHQLAVVLQEEVDRLQNELDQANQERVQAAEYGLAVLEEKQTLQQQYDDLETVYETTKNDFECAKEVRDFTLKCLGMYRRTVILLFDHERSVFLSEIDLF